MSVSMPLLTELVFIADTFSIKIALLTELRAAPGYVTLTHFGLAGPNLSERRAEHLWSGRRR